MKFIHLFLIKIYLKKSLNFFWFFFSKALDLLLNLRASCTASFFNSGGYFCLRALEELRSHSFSSSFADVP